MNAVHDPAAPLRLEAQPGESFPRLHQGEQLAPPGAVLIRDAGAVREAWYQIASPISADDRYACCYLYYRRNQAWSVRDDRYQCTGSVHRSYVPPAVLDACREGITVSDQTPIPAPFAPPPVVPMPPPRPPAVVAASPALAVVSPSPVRTAVSPAPADVAAPPPPAPSDDEVRRFEGHRYWIESIAFSPDGRRLLSGSGQPVGVGQSDFDYSVRVWDADTGRELRGLQGHMSWVTSVTFSPDGRQALSGSYDKTVRLWDVETGRQLLCLVGHAERIRGVAIAPDGKRALSGGYDKTLRLWDLETGRELRCLRSHEHWIMSVAFAPDGRRAASGSYDKTVRLWNIASEGSWLAGRLWGGGSREVACLLGHTQTVTSVSFARDGRYLLSGSVDKTLRLWDVLSGAEVRRFEGHKMGIASVALSPDGRRAVSGSLDETVRLWDTSTGQELRCFQGHTDAVTSVAFSPDGQVAASGSADKTIRIWRVD